MIGANKNLVAVLWVLMFIVGVLMVYHTKNKLIESECIQFLVNSGEPAVEAAKACK